jgi:uncharacterized protein (DUF4415 family)
MANTAKKKKDSLDPTSDDAAWDSRHLGADETYARVSVQGTENRLDEGLNLQMISMRLPQDAVEKFKVLARQHGLGYQPFIRQILMKYLREQK